MVWFVSCFFQLLCQVHLLSEGLNATLGAISAAEDCKVMVCVILRCEISWHFESLYLLDGGVIDRALLSQIVVLLGLLDTSLVDELSLALLHVASDADRAKDNSSTHSSNHYVLGASAGWRSDNVGSSVGLNQLRCKLFFDDGNFRVEH